MGARRPLTLTPLDDRPVVALCAGKDCRKRCEFAKIRDELDASAALVELGCVGICNGPVAVVELDGKPQVFEKVRKSSERRALVDAVLTGSTPSKPLRERAVTGSKRAKTLGKLDRKVR